MTSRPIPMLLLLAALCMAVLSACGGDSDGGGGGDDGSESSSGDGGGDTAVEQSSASFCDFFQQSENALNSPLDESRDADEIASGLRDSAPDDISAIAEEYSGYFVGGINAARESEAEPDRAQEIRAEYTDSFDSGWLAGRSIELTDWTDANC